MMNLMNALGSILYSNFLLILLFSVSWAFIYFGFQSSKFFLQEIFIRKLYSIKLNWWVKDEGIVPELKKISSGICIDSDTAEHMSRLIAEKISLTDKRFSELALEKSWSRIFLSEESVNLTINKVMQKDLVFLEKAYALLGVCSNDDRRREIAVLNLVTNPLTNDSEIRNILFTLLNDKKDNIRIKALYHLRRLISLNKDFERLQNIIENWPETLRHEAKPSIKIIQSNLIAAKNSI